MGKQRKQRRKEVVAACDEIEAERREEPVEERSI